MAAEAKPSQWEQMRGRGVVRWVMLGVPSGCEIGQGHGSRGGGFLAVDDRPGGRSAALGVRVDERADHQGADGE
ncbi:hypothetical protein GCM10010260_49450 [Streptomyces filipinensis]|uniref:Uncharacterized protein n=1 Tax=Streptomyces filipinensis TaxID=66887 RepID=A0A918MC38_9ACTN|nr:hypothetical protein GCM10010260_49450 [Streptomyces filipinensis]